MMHPRELHAFARAIAADPDSWAPLVRRGEEERVFALLHRDADCEAWLVCWGPGHDTGFHDHGGAAAAIHVVEGEITEDRLAIGGPPIRRSGTAGDLLDVGSADIHRVRHAGAEPAVTIHVYSPPLADVGRYAVATDGRLQRLASDGGEELEPISPAG